MLSVNSFTVYILSLLHLLNIVLILLCCLTGLVSIGFFILYLTRISSIEFLMKMKDALDSATEIYNHTDLPHISASNFKSNYETLTKLLNDTNTHIRTLIEELDMSYYRFKVSFILTLILAFLWVIIPSKDTYIKMVITHYSDSEMVNTKIIMDHIDATADRIIKTIGSKSR